MELIQRLGGYTSKEYIDGYLSLIKDNEGSCNTIWLPTKYGFPPLEVHEEYAQELLKVAEKFRKNGITVSLQLSNSIGHGEYIANSYDFSGLIYEGSPVQNIIGPDGTVSPYCFCWNDKYFKEYLLKELEIYMVIKPECLWVDDDFRTQNHAPVEYGCFCPDCIERFNKLHSVNFTREMLVEKITTGDVEWRGKYIEFQKEAMYNLMLDIAKTVHKFSPDTKIGLEHGHYGAYESGIKERVFEAIKEGTGKNAKSRPGGAPYYDIAPNEFIKGGHEINVQNALLPDCVDEKIPEIESTPNCAYGRNPYGFAFQSSVFFANGNTGMSYAMFTNLNEPFEWHNNEFKLFAQHREYWERLSDLNRESYAGGMRYYLPKEPWRRAAGKEIDEWKDDKRGEIVPWLRDAFPITVEKEETSVIILHPEMVDALTDAEIETLLKSNVMTDGESIALLENRGYKFPVHSTMIDTHTGLKLKIITTDDELNGKLEWWSPSFFTEGRNSYSYLDITGENVRVLGRYTNASKLLKPFFEGDENPYGIADVIFSTEQDGKWAVFSTSLWKGVMSFARHEQIMNVADYISGNGICARTMTPEPVVLLPRKNKDGQTVAVSIINCSVGRQENIKILIRNPKSKNMTYMSQYNGKGKVEFEEKNGDFVVNVPSVDAWSVMTIFCD